MQFKLFVIIVAVFLLMQLVLFWSTSRRRPREPRTRNRNHTGKLPAALIIGVRKGGTRALLDGIALHPQVRIVRRETHFFDSNFDRGIDWYSRLMPDAADDEIIVEKTPAYFTSESAPRRVFELNPRTKLILIVRHPTERLISDFTQVYHNKLELNKPLPDLYAEAFRQPSDGVDALNDDYKPVRNSLYDVHMANWLAAFPLEQFLIVNGDVFRANPFRELRRVERFLGLPQRISTSQLVFDERKQFFCFRRDGRTRPRCLGDSKGRRHERVDGRLQSRLADALRPHNQRFFQLVNRTFSWD